ncbi:sialate O-acetylesterase [Sphingobacterium faecale]|uniref:Sialate O-acetylesterase domain-containing protein n=1 Tax=Sphingobacterium faecale TaxID=2803775 RepID=A0ABS1R120_9SPHI|nr:sialate O-acetylesterase [Sphingobacterium faecale]MBL1408269.1 hypothetical protein [Sphingobacterium faecale]
MILNQSFMLISYFFLLLGLAGCSGEKGSAEPDPLEKSYSAVLKVDSHVQSNMVVQQNSTFVVSGEGTAKQWIKVNCSWASPEETDVQVADDGRWSVSLKTSTGSFDTHDLQVSGRSKLEFTDILVGEVWLCSGQSNMWWPMKDALGGLDEMLKSADRKYIRLLNVPQQHNTLPTDKLTAKWQKTSSSSLEWFSAVGYFFAKQLSESLNVPIGIINASWGDTTAEVWADRATVLNTAAVKDQALLQDNTPRADKNAPYKIGSAYNAMIYPLHRIPIKGAIWYQGESNMDNPAYYPELLNTLVSSWRSLWKTTSSTFPFYIAQICPYKRMYDFKINYANPNMRFAQQKASIIIQNSGSICNDDIADLNDIHPRNKKDVGIRFASLALKETYKKADHYRSPMYDRMTVEGTQIKVYFNHAEAGLKTSDGGVVTAFEIAGEDRVFYPADAVIDNNTVVLQSNNVGNPVHARMGWSYIKTTNLVHNSGIPVSIFKTYDWQETKEEQ